MKTGALSKLSVWESNADLVTDIVEIAEHIGLAVIHNSSSARTGAYDGYHRYLVLKLGVSENTSIRSRACLKFWETRFSRNYQPSKSGERRCLENLFYYLANYKGDDDA